MQGKPQISSPKDPQGIKNKRIMKIFIYEGCLNAGEFQKVFFICVLIDLNNHTLPKKVTRALKLHHYVNVLNKPVLQRVNIKKTSSFLHNTYTPIFPQYHASALYVQNIVVYILFSLMNAVFRGEV